jgi:hypothetical protein
LFAAAVWKNAISLTLCVFAALGTRSSTDEAREPTTDDETVVDPEQGNGTSKPIDMGFAKPEN